MLTKHKSEVDIPRGVLSGAKIAIITSQYNEKITQSLEDSCLRELRESGIKAKQIKIYKVPGALEIPVTAKLVARKLKPDVIIVLGAVIKGETYHFELVVRECARGCMDVALEFAIPVIFEVIPAFNLKQAQARAADDENNKGREAALSALKMLVVRDQLAK